MLQFITEAVVVCAIGGILGVIGGFATGWIVASFGTPVLFSAMPVALAFGCAFLTGLVFGYMPARKAASLDPVVALAAD
jgi:macrolide transport system ATP-binding/permease protein